MTRIRRIRCSTGRGTPERLLLLLRRESPGSGEDVAYYTKSPGACQSKNCPKAAKYIRLGCHARRSACIGRFLSTDAGFQKTPPLYDGSQANVKMLLLFGENCAKIQNGGCLEEFRFFRIFPSKSEKSEFIPIFFENDIKVPVY